MPIQTDAPIGLGPPYGWGFEGATSMIEAVATDDGDNSIIWADSGGALHTVMFYFPTLAGYADPVASASITSVARIYKAGQAPQEFYLLWNSAAGSNYYSSLWFTYATVTRTTAAATLAAVNGYHGMQVRGQGGPGNKTEIWVSRFYRSVDFSYPAPAGAGGGEFSHLIGGLIGAIGGALLLRDMPRLARAVRQRTGTLIKPDEYAQALSEWRSERHVALVGA